MNPYEHSGVAVLFYNFLCKDDLVGTGDQGNLGTLACRLADLVSDQFDIGLEPIIRTEP